MGVEETRFPRFFFMQSHLTSEVGKKGRQLDGIPARFCGDLLAHFVGLSFLRAAIGREDGALRKIPDAADKITDC